MKRAVRVALAWLVEGIRGLFRKPRPKSSTPTYRVITRSDAWLVNTAAGWVKIPKDGRWKFNGDLEFPSFWPSVVEEWSTDEGGFYCNHVIIRDGLVQFLSDCTHEWAGIRAEIIPLRPAEAAFYYERVPTEPVSGNEKDVAGT